ncbi:YoaK family protein [Phyllobacterium sp. P30BS-XVII]|uniref:YoaK family protein n=1 Tax=Phyllobacterium sp. P30BS-XVII TaxID=2587046 RepID=UPI000DDEADDA|nr:YoaK family protein [Phyllobacterium sp. P30BS-XVII]MBA8903149.1 uncharacterized membrane protein YoaK (UPF0700 family) [Phyllobacterium sp. P30BS-XVII]
MLPLLRQLAAHDRSDKADFHLACILTFVAGAVNAGGFLAVNQYTSHMSGIVSSMADNLALGRCNLFLAGFGAFTSFVGGAASSSILVNWGKRQSLNSAYAVPLIVEALLLLCFGLIGNNLEQRQWLFIPATVMLLCFIMGLQNAVITKLSNARIRTTHVTGMVTDMGIELGKLLYWNISTGDVKVNPVRADRVKLQVHASLILMFFCGGVCGAIGFKYAGFAASSILTLILMMSAIVPLTDDIKSLLRRKS